MSNKSDNKIIPIMTGIIGFFDQNRHRNSVV